MAYKVSFQAPPRDLGRADTSFFVHQDGSLLGELLVSKGALEWRPSNSRHSYKFPWVKFDEVAQKNGRPHRLP